MADQSQNKAVQTTGHAWDGDLQEFNNPLPSWWLWAFYASIAFAAIYWVLYPAWPVGDTYTKGVMTTTFKDSKGNEVTTGWNTRAEFIKDMQSGDEALKQQAYLKKVSAASYAEIAADPDMTAFAQSMAKVLFADNCAACHGSGGQGKIGLFPNLADDDWLWGGSVQEIHATITHGRIGFMPSFRPTFTDAQADDLADYVLSLSGHKVDPAKAAKGKVLFTGQGGGCYYCHGMDAKGLKSQGSANLTDNIWTIANVPGAPTLDAKRAAVRQVILNGVHRQMPTWEGRLSPADIKVLTVYVHTLGVGK